MSRTKPRDERLAAREVRTVPLDRVEVRADATGDTIHVVGHAAVFDTPTWIGPPRFGFEEVIARGAFKKTLADKADVRFLFNHNPDHVLARTESGSLTLAEDKVGLATDADLAPTTTGRDLAVLLERRDVDQMSFGFRVTANGDRWEEIEDKDGHVFERRTITEVELFDVSAVTYPAYTQTDLGLAAAELARELRGRPAREPDPTAPDRAAELAKAAADVEQGAPEFPGGQQTPETGSPGETHTEPDPSTVEPAAPVAVTVLDLLRAHQTGGHRAAALRACPACDYTAAPAPELEPQAA